MPTSPGSPDEPARPSVETGRRGGGREPAGAGGVRPAIAPDERAAAAPRRLGAAAHAAALRLLALRREVEGALVVAPAGLLTQWRAALREWAPELRVSTVRGGSAERVWQWRTPAHVYLTGYETLREDVLADLHAPARER